MSERNETKHDGIAARTLADYCDELLAAGDFQDYCPNGLQIEGERPVRLLATGVTANQALIDAAIAQGADALLVHHGFFWRNEPPSLVGIKGRRIATLIRAGLSLLVYHLPLDAHAEFGNNRQLARRLGIVEPRPTAAGNGLIWQGVLEPPLMAAQFAARCAKALGRVPLHIGNDERSLRTLAWCTGAAQGQIEAAAGLGVDAYLSGEIAEASAHQARETGIDYFALGHHATERDGVRVLGAHLAAHFGIGQVFIDIANPV